MATTLQFNVVEVELSEEEDDAYLLTAMEEVKDKPNASVEEVEDFKKWLKSIK